MFGFEKKEEEGIKTASKLEDCPECLEMDGVISHPGYGKKCVCCDYEVRY
jgi:hypothetical protein